MTTTKIKDLIIEYKDKINLGLGYFFDTTLRRGAFPLKGTDLDVFVIVLLYGVSDIYKFHLEDHIKNGNTGSWVIQAEDDNLLWWPMSPMEYYNAWMELPKKVYNWLGSLKVIRVI